MVRVVGYSVHSPGEMNFWFVGSPAWRPRPAPSYSGPSLVIWGDDPLPITIAWDGLEFM